MPSTCNTSLDLCAIRVSKTTEAGAPIAGANNGYISDAPVSLGVSIDTESGDDLTSKDGCGNLRYAFSQPDQLKSVSLDLELCQLDAELVSIMTGATVFFDGANAIGFQLANVGDTPPPICFEAWTKAWDVGGHQLVADFTSPADTWIHWVFPLTRWVQGDITMEHDLMTVPVSGKGSENPNITVNGPFNDWPLEIATLGGVTSMAGWFFDTAPPAATCTYAAVTSAAS